MVKATVCKIVPGPSSFRTLPCQGFHRAQRRADTCLTKPYVSMIENRERKSAPLRVLKRLAKALTVPVTALQD